MKLTHSPMSQLIHATMLMMMMMMMRKECKSHLNIRNALLIVSLCCTRNKCLSLCSLVVYSYNTGPCGISTPDNERVRRENTTSSPLTNKPTKVYFE
jgi:hypothetical protein